MNSEETVKQNKVVHEIVRELVSEIQLSQRQIRFLIFELAMNLENMDQMRAVTSLVRGFSEDLMMIDQVD